jgi:acetyl-CoA acetyltransferase
VVMSIERARDLRQTPVAIAGVMGGTVTPHAPWETNALRAGPSLFAAADVSASDVDLAELYDPFTGMCLLHIEGFGLAGPGEGAACVAAGRFGLDGDVPVNTHGGLLSEAYIHGLNHVVEAVQQLRDGGVVDDLCDGPHNFERSRCRHGAQWEEVQVGLRVRAELDERGLFGFEVA